MKSAVATKMDENTRLKSPDRKGGGARSSRDRLRPRPTVARSPETTSVRQASACAELQLRSSAKVRQ